MTESHSTTSTGSPIKLQNSVTTWFDREFYKAVMIQWKNCEQYEITCEKATCIGDFVNLKFNVPREKRGPHNFWILNSHSWSKSLFGRIWLLNLHFFMILGSVYPQSLICTCSTKSHTRIRICFSCAHDHSFNIRMRFLKFWQRFFDSTIDIHQI